jgi:hypothetical protein
MRGVCLNPPVDCHQLLEIQDPGTQLWMTLDPTFGLYTINASSGQGASVEDISAAARSLAFSTLSFQYLTPAGKAYAAAYYVDYPTLFVQVYIDDSFSALVEAAPPLAPYYDLIGASVNGPDSGFYALGCAAGAGSATADWDGTSKSSACTNGFTAIQWAISVSLGQGNSAATGVYTPHRFVF